MTIYDQNAHGFFSQVNRGESISITLDDEVVVAEDAAATATAGEPEFAARDVNAVAVAVAAVAAVVAEETVAEENEEEEEEDEERRSLSLSQTDTTTATNTSCCACCDARFGTFTRRNRCQFCSLDFCSNCSCKRGEVCYHVVFIFSFHCMTEYSLM